MSCIDRRREKPIAVLACLLGAVDGAVRALDHTVDVLTVMRIGADADARSDAPFLASERSWRGCDGENFSATTAR